MQRTNGRRGKDDEPEHRSIGREEVLPNFVSQRQDRLQSERKERGIRTCAGDENIVIIPDGDEDIILGKAVSGDLEDRIEIDRIPAIRHAVVADEQLWKIPDNWQHYLRVQNTGGPDEALYHIPDPSVWVVVEIPSPKDGDELRYRVKKVGKITVDLHDSLDREALHDLILRIEEQGEESDEVLAALRAVEEQWNELRRDYTGLVEKTGQEAVWGQLKADGTVVGESWLVNPWEGEKNPADVIPRRHSMDDDLLRRVTTLLIDANVISTSPDYEVGCDHGERLPTGYFVQALAEAGCSPPEIIDWMMVKSRGHTESTWGDVRGLSEHDISKNINIANETLTS